MRLASVVIGGLIVLILVIIGVSWIVVRLTAPIPPAPAAVAQATSPAIPDVPCGDGTFAFSEEDCARARTNTPVPPPTDPPPTPVPPTAVPPTAIPPTEIVAQRYPQCRDDMQDVVQVAAVLGGRAENWTAPDWVTSTSQGAWTFRSRESITLNYPGSGFFDTPQGRYFQQDVDASEASYHCEDPPP